MAEKAGQAQQRGVNTYSNNSRAPDTPSRAVCRGAGWPHVGPGSQAPMRCGERSVTAPERVYVQSRCLLAGAGRSVISSIIHLSPCHKQALRSGTSRGDITRFESKRETFEERA